MNYLKQVCIVTMLLLLCSCSSSRTQDSNITQGSSTTQNSSPSDVVEENLLAVQSEDWVISLVVDKVEEIDNTTYVESMGSDYWKELGLSEENISVVNAYYQAEYDGTKVPYNSGKLMQQFYLTRVDENSPWTIYDSMSPADCDY